MRAQWQSLYLQFSALIHRKSSERLYDLIQARHPELEDLLCIDELIFRQQSPGGDPAKRNAVLRALVREAQSELATSEIAANILILALWPGLDSVKSRLCRDFRAERDDVCTEIVGRVGVGIQKLDLARVTRIAATLIMNTERDIRRAFVGERNRRKGEICCDDAGTSSTVALTEPPEDVVSQAEWSQRLISLLGRDADLFLRMIVLGETQAEAGKALGLSPDAARKRHQRATAKLRAKMNSSTPLSHPTGPIGF